MVMVDRLGCYMMHQVMLVDREQRETNHKANAQCNVQFNIIENEMTAEKCKQNIYI